MSYKWKCDPEASNRKSKSKTNLTREKVDKHPLESSTFQNKSKGDFESLDPLSITELDPLTRMAADDLGIITVGNLGLRPSLDNFEPWSSKKAAILNKFTTKEKLSLTTSYFAAEHDVRGVSEKVLHRLEQLDLDVGSKQYFGGLSQDEYINKINQLDHQLTQAWQADLRVNALKITIQCCKLLGDTTVISFYPSKFVIITDILDKFGDMVYNRLLGKQSNAGDMLPPEVAKETCKNWFFKVGSIRELLPRVSIEMAIMKSYSFISQNPDYGRIFGRLLNSMWGIGDPVVAIYLRCYICRKAMELIPNHKELYMQCFQDLLLLHDQILENFRYNPHMSEAKVIMETYMNALSPAVDWILQCLVHRGEHLNYTIQLISNVPPFWKSVLIRSVLNTFPPNFIGDECLNIIEMILTLESNLGPILKSLGMCLIVIDSPQHESKEIWKRIWPQIKNIHRRDQYLECCEVWVEFMVKNFGSEIVNSFIEDLVDHLITKDFDQYQGKLVSIIEKLLSFSNDISVLLLMDKFIKIVTLLKNKVDVIKSILTTFHTKHPENQNDNILISTLLHLASLLHDSIDALSPVDEVKQIGNLINGVILKVNYGRDFEKQLQFYDEARGSFSNNDIVLYQLVQCVNKLGMDVKKIVGGHHTKRTKSFLCACIAYSFITIPSIESYYLQLQLYLLTAQVSYGNQNVSQGDSCLKAAITILNENKDEIECSEEVLIEYVNNLQSTILAVPDHPKEPTLYFLKALLTIDWNSPKVHLRALSLLSAYSQEKYAYVFNGVDANDSMYGSDPKFLEEIDTQATIILNILLDTLKELGDQNNGKKQSLLSLELFMEIINWGNVSEMGNLALNLWNLSRKNLDHKLAIRTLESIRKRSQIRNDIQALSSKISIE